MILTLLAGMFLAVLSGCQNHLPEVDEGDIVARVGERTLSWSRLQEIIPDQSSPEDSARIAQRFVDDWIEQHVLLAHAERVLSEEEQNFEKEMTEYRNSLLAYSFERKFISQRLDTMVSMEEIEAYYTENQQNFELKDYIVKARFCILAPTSPKLEKFKKTFFGSDDENLVEIEQYCVENGASYHISDEWMYYSDLIKKVPLDVYNVDQFLKGKKNTIFEDANHIYLLQIRDYQLKNAVSPLSFEKENIRNMIINRRKIELLNKMRRDLYKEAVKNKLITTYYEEEE